MSGQSRQLGSAGGLLGSLSFATGERLLNVLPPAEYLDRLRDDKPHFDAQDFASLTDPDRRALLQYLIVNYHERVHHHQMIGSIAGLQIFETSLHLVSVAYALVRETDFDNFPILPSLDPDHPVRHAHSQLAVLGKGVACECTPHLVPTEPVPVYHNEEAAPGFVVMPSPAEHIIYFLRPDDAQPLAVFGSGDIYEAHAWAMEVVFALRLFKELGIDGKPEWYPFPYGAEYTFLLDALVVLEGRRRTGQIDLFDVSQVLAWLAVNPGSTPASRSDRRSLSTMKLWDALQELVKLDLAMAADEMFAALDRALVDNRGYTPMAELRERLLSNAHARLSRNAEIGIDSITRKVGDSYYAAQIRALRSGLWDEMSGKGHCESWNEYPAPPITIGYQVDTAVRKVLFVSREPDTVWWFLHMILSSILTQMLESSSVVCPLKAQDVFCPRRTEECGRFVRLSAYESTRGCSFDLLCGELSTGEATDLQDHLDFFFEVLEA